MIKEQRVMALIAHLVLHEGVSPEAVENAVSATHSVRLGDSIIERIAGPDHKGDLTLLRSFAMNEASRLFR